MLHKIQVYRLHMHLDPAPQGVRFRGLGFPGVDRVLLFLSSATSSRAAQLSCSRCWAVIRIGVPLCTAEAAHSMTAYSLLVIAVTSGRYTTRVPSVLQQLTSQHFALKIDDPDALQHPTPPPPNLATTTPCHLDLSKALTPSPGGQEPES